MLLNKIQLERYADVLIWGLEKARSKKFKPYDQVVIRYDLAALPLLETIYKKLVQKKWHVSARALSTPVLEKDFYTYSDATQRKFLGNADKVLYNELNGNIFLSAPTSLTHLKDIDPKKMGEAAVARKPLREIVEKREEQGLYGWTLCTCPTEELAKRASMSVAEYTDQIIKACFLNEKDPVGKWESIYRDSLEIKSWLNSLPVKTFTVTTKNMELEVLLGEQRKFIGISGHNIPSFELFTSPDWRGTRGTYYANLQTYKSGNYVQGVKLEFEKGRAVKINATKGQDFVRKTLAMDKTACQIGEFSLTDKRFSKIDKFMADILFDENFGGEYGNCHIAVGASYSDTFSGDPAKLTKASKKALGFNDSALHWDLINTEDKVVTAKLKNGKTVEIYAKGQFAR